MELYDENKAKILILRIRENLSKPYEDISKMIDDLEISQDSLQEQTIRNISKTEKSIYDNINEIIQSIINKEYNIDWASKR
jgi:uncharacterized protein Yka (UPF0111/DUF47 family)